MSWDEIERAAAIIRATPIGPAPIRIVADDRTFINGWMRRFWEARNRLAGLRRG